MSYMCKRMRFRNAIEVYEYHTAKYGAPGQERQEKKKATPEQMAKRNRYNRERLARWKIRNNFDVDDYYTRRTKDRNPWKKQRKTGKHFCRYSEGNTKKEEQN